MCTVKKLLSLLTALVMVFMLSGCGNTDISTNYTEAPSVETAMPEIPEDVVTACQDAYAYWVDLGVISIPPDWSFTFTDDGPGYLLDIYGEGVGGFIRMAVWGVMVGDPSMIVNEFSSQQIFGFSNGRSGYMLEGHLFESNTLIIWLQDDTCNALSLYYGGNDSVFTENEELILQIAKTLTYQQIAPIVPANLN